MHQQIADKSLQLLTSAVPASFLDLTALSLFLIASSALLLREYTWDKPDPFLYKWFERPQEKLTIGQKSTQTTRNIAQRLQELVRTAILSAFKTFCLLWT